MEKGLSKLIISISSPFSVPLGLVFVTMCQEQACSSECCKHLQFVISVFVDDVGPGCMRTWSAITATISLRVCVSP